MCAEKSPWELVLDFHGHLCLEITLGYRIAQIAQREMGIKPSPNTELVVTAETHSCALDAFQIINQATYGRGNLSVSETGEHRYHFQYSQTDEVVTIQLCPQMLAELESFRTYSHPREKQGNLLKGVRYLLDMKEEEFCTISRSGL